MTEIQAALHQWYQSRCTGTSSKTIAHVLAGVPVEGFDIPYDPSDLLRCVRLLDHMDSAGFDWRSRLDEVAESRPRWRGFIDQWADLEALLKGEIAEGRRAPLTHARMREIRKALRVSP